MSYLRKFKYTIVPAESFKIIKNCSGCGCKLVVHNTNCFRVNANGNRIDLWLIYQCVKCKHTNNLIVYKRQRAKPIWQEEYGESLINSIELAFKYGTDSRSFVQNNIIGILYQQIRGKITKILT